MGAGGGAGDALYAWFMQNPWPSIVLIAIVALGAMWLLGRASIYVVALGLAAAMIVKFAPDIRALLM
jgi:hypothetical protein